MKTKLLGIFLIAALVVPITATFIILKKQQNQVRKEVKWKMIAGIEKSELVLLKFSSVQKETELKWKHAKEFQFKGEFYDIVEIEEHGDSTHYWCWWDKEETELNQKLQNLLCLNYNDNPCQKNKHHTIQKLLKSLFIENETPSKNAVKSETIEHLYSSIFETIKRQLLPELSPPELI